MLTALAVVLEEPQQLRVRELPLQPPGPDEVVVEVEWTGISTGTERLLWSGKMPPFPGMGYPLVPGYETVGRIVDTGDQCTIQTGQRVFVSGAACFGEIRGLFGGAASRLVVSESKVIPISESLDQRGTLLALAATAVHAVNIQPASSPPDLIVGHGVLGRLLARVAMAKGAPPPVVWEVNSERIPGGTGYEVMHPADDTRRDYRSIYDASGVAGTLNSIMPHLAKHGVIVLAGFYSEPVSFNFAPAFMREANIRIAAEWQPDDLVEASQLVESGRLSLDGLITHHATAHDAPAAYQIAFGEPGCLKMILDWRSLS